MVLEDYNKEMPAGTTQYIERCAFALCASGERYMAYRDNLVTALDKYAHGIGILDVDVDKASRLLPRMLGKPYAITMARLAIPLMDEFQKYDRVIYVDADTDVTSGKFLDIIHEETSEDGLAAVEDIGQNFYLKQMAARFPEYGKASYFNAGLVVMDLHKIDRNEWRRKIWEAISEHERMPFAHYDQDILNAFFDIKALDVRYNWIWRRKADASNPPWMVHYTDRKGHEMLDEIIAFRNGHGNGRSHKDRCIVVSPRHGFVKSWVRSYFMCGNSTPLVIVPWAGGNWTAEDMEYCKMAASFSNGTILDCNEAWSRVMATASASKDICDMLPAASRLIMKEVAQRLSPKTWAWIRDDVEITGCLDECLDYAEKAEGLACLQFMVPGELDNIHPAAIYRDADGRDHIGSGSMVIFHGDANARLSEDLSDDDLLEGDESAFARLYNTNEKWHDGFRDFSARAWLKTCDEVQEAQKPWTGKALDLNIGCNDDDMARMWASKSETLPMAPFETCMGAERREMMDGSDEQTPIDAVFVIGTGSQNNNEELRYALRNLDAHCKFIRDVYICGVCPKWVDKSKVKHLQWPDRFSHAKDANIIDKLRHACEHPGIAKRILFCSDDQFQTKECSWEDFEPRYLRRYMSSDNWYESRHRVWHTRLRKTLERDVKRRIDAGMDASEVFYYQPHIWMQIDRDRFIDYAKWSNYENRDDTIIASGYFNFIDAGGKPDFGHTFLGNNDYKVPNFTHIAYHDGSFKAAMAILKRMFPEPCRFEVDSGLQPGKAQPAPKAVEPQVANIPPEIIVSVSPKVSDDPSAANSEEMDEISRMSSKIRDNPIWNGLLGEVSRAEELRLFGVRGWRTVWNDIIFRWDNATDGGRNNMPVTEPRSGAAEDIIRKYLSNPDSMRTKRFGTGRASRTVPSFGRQMPRQAPEAAMASLRRRARSALQGWGK